MRKKWNIETASIEYKKIGLKLLEKEYINLKTPMLAETQDGYKVSVCLGNVISGQSYLIFGKSNPCTIENINLYFQKNNIGIKILSKKYENNQTPLTFMCSCGNIFNRTWQNVYAGQIRCGECAKNSRNEKQRKEEKDVFDLFAKNGFKLISSYEKNSTPLTAIDKNGYYIKISYANLLKGRRPRKFSLEFNSENFSRNIENFILENSIDCKFISVEGNDGYGHTLLKFMCSCGDEFIVTQSDFINLKKYRCSNCMDMISNLEEKIRRWLILNNVEFDQQKRFDKCRDKKPLPFDFYLPKYNTCIECDGHQHYYKNSKFYNEKVQLHDKIKTEYCQKNGIRLLRFPFWYFYTDKYSKILFKYIGQENLAK